MDTQHYDSSKDLNTLISEHNLGLQNLNHSVYSSCLSKEVHDHQVEHQVAQNKVSKGPFWGKILREIFLANRIMPYFLK